MTMTLADILEQHFKDNGWRLIISPFMASDSTVFPQNHRERSWGIWLDMSMGYIGCIVEPESIILYNNQVNTFYLSDPKFFEQLDEFIAREYNLTKSQDKPSTR